MKKLALAATVLLAGCAATNAPTGGARLTGLEKESRVIDEREQRCIAETLARGPDQTDKVGLDATAELRTQSESDERDLEISECRTRADQETAELSAHARTEYELQAQQAHDRAALMMILTMSHPR